MSIFLATSRGKYTWKQTPGQAVLISGGIIGTHCDRRDARIIRQAETGGMFYEGIRLIRKKRSPDRTTGRLPEKTDPTNERDFSSLCSAWERAGAPLPGNSLPFACATAYPPGHPFPCFFFCPPFFTLIFIPDYRHLMPLDDV